MPAGKSCSIAKGQHCEFTINMTETKSCSTVKEQHCEFTRDVVLIKRCVNALKKLAIWKQPQTHLEAKHAKGLGTPFPRVLVDSKGTTLRVYYPYVHS